MILLCVSLSIFTAACIVLDIWAWSRVIVFEKQHRNNERAYALALFSYLLFRAGIASLVTASAVTFRYQFRHSAHGASTQIGELLKRTSLILQICIALVSVVYGVMLNIRLGVWFAKFSLVGDRTNSIYCAVCGAMIISDTVIQCYIVIGCIFCLAGRPHFLSLLLAVF